MSEFIGLSTEQIAVIDANTKESIISGLAGRYSRALLAEAENDHLRSEIAEIPESEKGIHKIFAKWTEEAYSSELPFAFRFEPSNMARAVIMEKISRQNGHFYQLSQTQIGLVEGIADEGQPTGSFTSKDLDFAVKAIAAQEQVGLRISS